MPSDQVLASACCVFRLKSKGNSKLIGLSALLFLSSSPFLSPLHACVCRQHTDVATFVLPPTSKLAPALPMHTHSCHNHLYAMWPAVMGCHGFCKRVVWQAASLFPSYLCQFEKGVIVGAYGAEEEITAWWEIREVKQSRRRPWRV